MQAILLLVDCCWSHCVCVCDSCRPYFFQWIVVGLIKPYFLVYYLDMYFKGIEMPSASDHIYLIYIFFEIRDTTEFGPV